MAEHIVVELGETLFIDESVIEYERVRIKAGWDLSFGTTDQAFEPNKALVLIVDNGDIAIDVGMFGERITRRDIPSNFVISLDDTLDPNSDIHHAYANAIIHMLKSLKISRSKVSDDIYVTAETTRKAFTLKISWDIAALFLTRTDD